MFVSPPDSPAPAVVPARTTAVLAYMGRLAILTAGLFCFAAGVVLTFKSQLGLGPWDCFHLGLSLHLPITVGEASIITGGLVILLSLFLGVRPGVGTIGNMVLIGLFFDLLYPLVPNLDHPALIWQLAVDVVGVVIVGIGSGLYIKAGLGAGPRDSLMLALTRRTGQRVSLMRALVELSALTIGFLMGGTVGLGTLVFAFGVGPAVELGFRLLRVEAHH
jgi:uncharacterized membrane protein YczE